MERHYIKVLFLLFLSSLPGLCYAWDISVGGAHWSITHNMFYSGSPLCPNGYCFGNPEIITQADLAEDSAPNWLSHFDPPLPHVLSAYDWAFSSTTRNIYNWNSAINNACKINGWRSLGHVLHLFQDMCVPAHVRKDLHPGVIDSEFFPKINYDPLEKYAKGLNYVYWPISGNILIECNDTYDIMNFFIMIEAYTQSHYYSADTCFSPDFPGPTLDTNRLDDPKYFYDTNGREIAYKGKRYKISSTIQGATIDSVIAFKQCGELRGFVTDVTLTVMDGYERIITKECPGSIFPITYSVGVEGSTSSVDVTMPYECCKWSAVSNVNWITINSTTSNGIGNSKVQFLVEPNFNTCQRKGTLTIAGETLTVEQDGNLPLLCGQYISTGNYSTQTATNPSAPYCNQSSSWYSVGNYYYIGENATLFLIESGFRDGLLKSTSVWNPCPLQHFDFQILDKCRFTLSFSCGPEQCWNTQGSSVIFTHDAQYELIDNQDH